jgi:hypothetical protein
MIPYPDVIDQMKQVVEIEVVEIEVVEFEVVEIEIAGIEVPMMKILKISEKLVMEFEVAIQIPKNLVIVDHILNHNLLKL